MTTWRAKATSTSAIAIASFLALGLATAAHAQEGASAPPRDTGAAQADSDRNKEIIVTGPRRNDLTAAQSPTPDRKSVVWGKSVSVPVDIGGRRIIKKEISRTNE